MYFLTTFFLLHLHLCSDCLLQSHRLISHLFCERCPFVYGSFPKRLEDESYHFFYSSSVCDVLRFFACSALFLYPTFPPPTPIPPSVHLFLAPSFLANFHLLPLTIVVCTKSVVP